MPEPQVQGETKWTIERRPADGKPLPPLESRFKPGQSGNPGGKPKGASVVGPMLRALARDPDEDGYGRAAVEIAEKAIQFAKDGDGKAVAAILGLMDRTDGPLVKERINSNTHVVTGIELQDRRASIAEHSTDSP